MTTQDISDIMDAICGTDSVDSWCDQIRVDGNKPITDGGIVTFRDRDTGLTFDLTLEKLIHGVHKWVEDGGITSAERRIDDPTYRVDVCMIDGDCANRIVKFALFGDIADGKEG